MKIYYGQAIYDNKEITATVRVLKRNSFNLIDGPSVKKLEEKIAKLPTLKNLYQKLELPLVKIMFKLERNGALIDVASLYNQQLQIKAEMASIQIQAFEIAGNEFNLESPKQIQQILFSEEGLGLEPKKKTPKGQPSTNEEALKLLDHPLVDLIMSYRTLTKLNSTYLEALPKQINTRLGHPTRERR